jgi:hypothetical protein
MIVVLVWKQRLQEDSKARLFAENRASVFQVGAMLDVQKEEARTRR